MWILAISFCVTAAGYSFYINTIAYIESGLVTTIDTTTAPLEVKCPCKISPKNDQKVFKMSIMLISLVVPETYL